MEIVINISEESYKNIKEQVDKRDYPDMQIGRAIADGKPLTMLFEKIRTDIAEHSYPVRYDHNSIEKGMTLTGIMQVLMDNEIKELNNADSN